MNYPINSTQVAEVFAQYPDAPRTRLLELRQLIFATAAELGKLNQLIETLKWGEPAYTCRTGNTIRLDWKETTPDLYYLNYICTTTLVETFKVLYSDHLQFEKNRAIVLGIQDELPIESLKHCFTLALDYHRIKHLPMLGA